MATGKHAKDSKTSPRPDYIRKLYGHMIFIGIAVIFSVGSTFVSSGIMVHIVSATPALGSVGQEIFDMINRF
jgi:hypothetical protein